MVDSRLLIDFGSTFTKGVVISLDDEEIIAQAEVPSTVETNVRDGYNALISELKGQVSSNIIINAKKRACSSAAGGLRMVIVGLVPELTVEAGRKAALNAGAKVVGVFASILSDYDLQKVESLRPDLILLTGGSDGGNREVILENARLLSLSSLKVPVIVAGNKNVSKESIGFFRNADKEAILTENVMPAVDKLNIEPARETIRRVFINRIIKAKGIDKVQDKVDILMPTPNAVLQAVSILSKGTSKEKGLGELMVIDVGGATTDVYTAASGNPIVPGVILKGLPEPFIKRTVEGDLGIRHNAMSIFELVGLKRFIQETGMDSATVNEHEIATYCRQLKLKPRYLPKETVERAIDFALTRLAVRLGVERHAGRVETTYIPGTGEVFIQTGKDLRGLKLIIGTGGALVFSPISFYILQEAIFNPINPNSLKPRKSSFMLDAKYIMFALGLLSTDYPDKVVRMAKKYFTLLA